MASEYLRKGSPTFIEGRLKLDTWEADGQKKYKLRVIGERLQLLGGRGEDERGGGSEGGGRASGGFSAIDAPVQRLRHKNMTITNQKARRTVTMWHRAVAMPSPPAAVTVSR